MTTDDITTSISAKLEALTAEIEQLTAARDALLQNATSEQAPEPKAPPRKTRRRRTSKRQPLSPERLEQALSAHGGATTASLAEATGASKVRVLAALRELEKAGQVRRTGQRRGTRWHLVTDEDRIRERAAELASRSSRRTKA
jgi:uncharacterized membrane protein